VARGAHARSLDGPITAAVSNVGFAKSATRQRELHGELFQFVYDTEIVDLDRADAVADRLLEPAKVNLGKLARKP